MTLTEQIFQAATREGILFDASHSPIKIGPDCYMFSGVRNVEPFSKTGHTRVERFYALTGGDIIKIIQ